MYVSSPAASGLTLRAPHRIPSILRRWWRRPRPPPLLRRCQVRPPPRSTFLLRHSTPTPTPTCRWSRIRTTTIDGTIAEQYLENLLCTSSAVVMAPSGALFASAWQANGLVWMRSGIMSSERPSPMPWGKTTRSTAGTESWLGTRVGCCEPCSINVIVLFNCLLFK